jgi:chaperonin GroEL
LSGGIATVHIGALTPEEKEEKIALVQDAQNSIRSALDYGILPGGGTALLKVAQMLSETKHTFSSDAMKKGYDAVLSTMRKLSKQLVASVKPDDFQYIVQQVAHEKDFWSGYNVRTEKIENLKESKIIDSAAIEILAMKYTASAVGSFAISDGVIVNKVPNLNYDVNDRRVLEAMK